MENNGRNPTGFSKLTISIKNFKLGSKLMRYLNSCDLRWLFVWLFAKPELFQSLLQIHRLQYTFQEYTWGRWTDDNFSVMKWVRTQSQLSWNFFIEDERKEYQLYVYISKFTTFGSEGGFLWASQPIQTRKHRKSLQEVFLYVTTFSTQFQENRVIWSLQSYWNSYRKKFWPDFPLL